VKIAPARALRPSRIAAVAAVAGGVVLASVLPGYADVSTQSPSVAQIKVESPATLKADGAAVLVSVTYVCPIGGPNSISVQLTQNVGGDIASGYGYVQYVACTATPQTAEIAVHAASGGKAFRRGVAFASAQLMGGMPGGVTDNREIQVVRSQSN